MQQQQRELPPGSAILTISGRGHGFETSPRCVLQECQQAAAPRPQQRPHPQPGEVAQGQGGGVAGREGEEEDKGAGEGAGPAPGRPQELPVIDIAGITLIFHDCLAQKIGCYPSIALPKFAILHHLPPLQPS